MPVANASWDLQVASRGRFVLGLGSQVRAHNEKRFSVPWSAPAPRVRAPRRSVPPAQGLHLHAAGDLTVDVIPKCAHMHPHDFTKSQKNKPLTLADLGVTPRPSSDWQALAGVPEPWPGTTGSVKDLVTVSEYRR